MKIKTKIKTKNKFFQFATLLLVFAALLTEKICSAGKSNQACTTSNIDPGQLTIAINPINFRNSQDNSNHKPMYMQLSVSEKTKKCMDENKFNLKIELDELPEGLKVSSTATSHIVTIGRTHLEIESCKFDGTLAQEEASNDELMQFMGFTNDGSSKECILFIAPSELWEIKENIKAIELSFDEQDTKVICDDNQMRKKVLAMSIKDDNNQDASIEDGFKGRLSFFLPSTQAAGQGWAEGGDQVYIQAKLGAQVAQKVCQKLGYRMGKFMTESGSGSEKSPTFTLKPANRNHQKFCILSFSNIVAKKEFTPEEILEIQENCITEKPNKNHLQIYCSKEMGKRVSLTAQNSCGDGETCPTGFSHRKSDVEISNSGGSDFCLPNRCFCENGLAATSSYEAMRIVCGVRKEDEMGVEDVDDDDDDDEDSRSSRIHNGQPATQTDFPFQCQLYKDRKTNTNPFCSASILSPLYLLTAGHCLVEQTQTLAKVYASVESETEGKVSSSKIFVHENYYESIDQVGFLLNDIGLVSLSEAVLFNEDFRPICIHDTSVRDMESEELIIAGYGGSDTLKQAVFNVEERTECASKLNFPMDNGNLNLKFDNQTEIIDPWQNKLCAGSNSPNGVATCSGDSGAPLMIEVTELILGKLTVKYSLVGIVSAGAADCSTDQLPTIFTDVYGYTDWIYKTINETEYVNAGRYCTMGQGG